MALLVEADLTGSVNDVPFRVTSEGARIEFRFEHPPGRALLLELRETLQSMQSEAKDLTINQLVKAELQIEVVTPDGPLLTIGHQISQDILAKFLGLPSARIHLFPALKAFLKP